MIRRDRCANDWVCGLHSGIPACCIRWWTSYKQGLRFDDTGNYLVQDAYMMAVDRWHDRSPRDARGVALYGSFIPCPAHLSAPPTIRLRCCPGTFRFSQYVNEEDSLERLYAA